MSNIEIFRNSDFGEIRTVIIDSEPWFVASDICKALELSNTTVSIERLDDDEKSKLNLGLSGGATNCVNEYGLYSLVLASRKSEAKVFKRWVTHEVLPSIRKRGIYATDNVVDMILENPDFGIKLLTDYKREKEEKERLQAELDRSKDWYSIKRVASLNGVSWKTFDWRRLKKVGKKLGYEVKKIFDANYGEVNVYHREVWENAYPQYEL